MAEYRFEKFEKRGIRGRRWYFRFVAPNNEKMLQSEGYNSSSSRDSAIDTIQKEAKHAGVVDAD
jgi:uncharacterized protein YegP (UPF0339 family)